MDRTQPSASLRGVIREVDPHWVCERHNYHGCALVLSLPWLRHRPSVAACGTVQHHGSGHHVFDDDDGLLTAWTHHASLVDLRHGWALSNEWAAWRFPSRVRCRISAHLHPKAPSR